MIIFLITLFLFGLVVLLMSIGVILGNKSIRGSCGGEGAVGPDGEILSCETCPNRNEKFCQNNKDKNLKNARV